MSEELEKPNGQTVTFPTIVKGFCRNCKTPLTIPFPPIVVHEAVVCSTVAIPHPVGIECPNCHLYHNLRVHPTSSVFLCIFPEEKPFLNEEKRVIPFTGHLKSVT